MLHGLIPADQDKVWEVLATCGCAMCGECLQSSEKQRQKTSAGVIVLKSGTIYNSSILIFVCWCCWALFVHCLFMACLCFFFKIEIEKFGQKWSKSLSPGPSLCYILFPRTELICQTLLRKSNFHQFVSKTDEE